ncbi:hypothetical protein LTR37_012605 [Vermiconidia calcicola]|uniref:Uncharacterized protein n=1 Tax=Vermiconidia calcicola TaxID=1690605 RepID=A0ACC3MZ41_9PEZI|nr:hypothetical protein LTR37_012605 [Vermiconidia calcicola]
MSSSLTFSSQVQTASSWRQSHPPHGLIAMLNNVNVPGNSVFHTQPWMNLGAGGHPVTIVGTKDNGRFSTCCQVTSFGNTPIEVKYPDPNNLMRQQYLSIGHDRTVPHSGQKLLGLANGKKMLKQSYVHLDQFFEIETQYLESFYQDSKCLDSQSVGYPQAQFRDFIGGVIPRPRGRSPSPPGQRNSRPSSPLGLRRFTPTSLGVPDVPPQLVTVTPVAPWFVTPPARNCAIKIVAPQAPTKHNELASNNWRQTARPAA